ncbi:putative multidrug resistance protein fnx1 [Thozetella sp. PMI_491]|nr:putative multidrug resistance protein fnx1 [Thozetella sp. PMI_491]
MAFSRGHPASNSVASDGDTEKAFPDTPSNEFTSGDATPEVADGHCVSRICRPHVLIADLSLAVQVFMVNLEIPVVTTSLVAITRELNGFDKASWILSTYLLGYAAVIVIFAKFSDIFGRKSIFATSIIIFIVFSAACSAAQTMTQLIIFRAFQGIGGGGCFSLSQVIVTDLVPPERYAKFVSQLSMFFSKSTLKKVDILGSVILLFAVLSLTAGFEEADAEFAWNSAYVITLLVLSACLWILLFLWERRVTRSESMQEPVLPWRFFQQRVMVGLLLGLFFLGGPIVVSIFQLPERFQLVHGLSGLDAGVRLIPFSLAVPFGTGLAAGMAGKFKIPALFVIMLGACLQVVGYALLATLPVSLDIAPRMYGFEIIAGFGCGMNFIMFFLMIPRVTEPRDQAVGMGAGNQFRLIGSTVMIAVCTSVFNGYLRSQLGGLLQSSETNILNKLAQELASLPHDLQTQIRLLLAESYNRQTFVLCASAAGQIPAALMLWKKEQILV